MSSASAGHAARADKQAITEVLMRYCRGIDRLDRDTLLSVYWPDATESRGTYFGSGPGFVNWVKGFLGPLRTQHFMGNILIELTSPNSARGESYVQAYHLGKGAFSGEVLIVGARYLDQFEKRGDEWRIKSRTMVVDYSRTAAATETKRYENTDMPLGKKFPDDLLYHVFGKASVSQ